MKRLSVYSNIMIDKRRMLQILLTFLADCLKLTQQKGILKVIFDIQEEHVMEEKNETEKEVYIKLQITIDSNLMFLDNLQTLFRDFTCLYDQKYLQLKSKGLGLSICKSMIDFMGGSVTAKS